MYFWKFLANFVSMKNSIDFLPERKQRDLHELVRLIRDEVKDVVMVILYGTPYHGVRPSNLHLRKYPE